MLDHVSLGTANLARASAFYTSVFAQLGYKLQHSDATQTIYGAGDAWSFCLYPAPGDAPLNGARTHVAITAPSQHAVDAFHAQAEALGAASLRKPGLRPDINDRYYGAMLHDLDHHTIEVVHWARS
ncbi:MAG TPA: VOC family protein [Burkholderiaceae bacterium]